MEDWQEAQLVEKVKNGAVFIYPTDTCYGLGCSIYSTEGIDAVYRIKGRDPEKTVPVLADPGNVQDLASPNPVEKKAMEQHWPGNLTLVMNADKSDQWDPRLIQQGTIALRSPGLEPLRDFLSRVGPIVGTSANISGKSAPATLEDVHPQLLAEVDFVLGDYGGEGESSTVAQWDGSTATWVIHRKGPVSIDQLPTDGDIS